MPEKPESNVDQPDDGAESEEPPTDDPDFDADKYMVDGTWYDEEKMKMLLDSTKVFFYPACGLDWQPIQKYASQCDLFVYCDWNIDVCDLCCLFYAENTNDDELNLRRWQDGPVGNLVDWMSVDWLSNKIGRMNHLPWLLAQPVKNDIEPCGKLAELTCRAGEKEKKIGLLYLTANPIEAYRILFTEKKTSPTIIYLKRPELVTSQAWQFLAGADGPIANVAASNPIRPSRVIMDNSPVNLALWLTQSE